MAILGVKALISIGHIKVFPSLPRYPIHDTQGIHTRCATTSSLVISMVILCIYLLIMIQSLVSGILQAFIILVVRSAHNDNNSHEMDRRIKIK
jgi:hypothetical protein